MKRYTIILFVSLLVSPVSNLFSGDFGAGNPAGSQMGMPQLNDKEMEALNEWAKVLEGFSEKELEELASIGEVYMKELEEQGIDPMEFLFNEESPIWEKPPMLDEDDAENEADEEEATPAAAPTQEPAPLKVPASVVAPEVLTITDKQKVKEVKHKLEDIAEKIGSLRQKAESRRSLAEKLHPFELALSDIVYFVLTIKEDHLLKFLFEKKFEPLYHLLMELHQALETYEPQIYVTEFSLEGEDPYAILDVRSSDSFETIYKKYQTITREENPFTVESRLKEAGTAQDVITAKLEKARKRWNKVVWAYEAIQAKENSLYAFETVLNIFQQMIYKHDLIAQLKELVRAYDPEAAKMKEEQEKKEKKAREEQERLARQRPPWTQPVFAPAPAERDRYSYDDNSYYSGGEGSLPMFSYDTPSVGSDIAPIQSKADSTSKKSGGKKGASQDKDTDKEKDKKDKNKDAKEDTAKKPGSKKSPEAVRAVQKEVDQKIGRVKSSLDSIKKTLSDNGVLLETIPAYLATPYDASQKATAEQMNKVLTTITEEFTTLEKTLKEDAASIKDDLAKKRYKSVVGKEYKSFAENDTVEKGLEALNTFGATVPVDPTKNFLVAGVPLPEGQPNPLAQQMRMINNPVVTRGSGEQTAVNHIQNFKKSYASLTKRINDSFKPKED